MQDTVRIRQRARALPIFQTTSYVFKHCESAVAYFNLQEYGNTYSRIMNPTVAAFEERVANLDGGAGSVAFASGLAAQSAAFFTLLAPGDHVVASSALYGGTITQLKHVLGKLSVGVDFIDPDDLDAWRAAINDATKLLFAETIGNPGGNVLDIETVAELAHAHDCPLMIDNTFATPYLCRPLEWGADIVVYSATKHIDGRGRTMGGAVLGSQQYHDDHLNQFLRHTGPSMSPFNAWILVKGLETLEMRMVQHCANAREVAEFLESQSGVRRVFYPALDSHPQAALARRQMRDSGSVVSFEIEGDKARAFRFLNALELIDISNNLGDAKSIVTHPTTTTHQRLSDEQRAALGITPGLVRLSVGIEDPVDLIADLKGALEAV